MRLKNAIFLLLVLALYGCFSQHRLDFDNDQFAIISCDERIKIKHVNIKAADDEGLGYEIRIQGNQSGSNIIYLNGENEGYYTNDPIPLTLNPNEEYIITSVHGDSSLEMKLFTNADSKVDSVLNEFGCLN